MNNVVDDKIFVIDGIGFVQLVDNMGSDLSVVKLDRKPTKDSVRKG